MSLGLGVNFGEKLSEYYKIKDVGWVEEGDVIKNLYPPGLTQLNETVKSSDFGFTGKVKFLHKHFFAVLRYYHGTKDISRELYLTSEGHFKPAPRQTNSNIQVGVGYTFIFGKRG